MPYWLLKSEPSAYSWEQFEKDGKTAWTGIRNYAARLHLNTMRKGDEAFFYHSNEGLNIVGIAKITKEAYHDPTTDDERWVAVDIKPVKKLKEPVSMQQIKKEKVLQNMALLKISRLSVQPVTEAEWKRILELSNS